jgi:hypothetical protein
VGPENQQVFVNQLAGASRKTVLNVLSTLSSTYIPQCERASFCRVRM